MPVFILVGKVVLLICIKSALIMSLPARTINKTSLNLENLMNFVVVAIVSAIVLGHPFNKRVEF